MKWLKNKEKTMYRNIDNAFEGEVGIYVTCEEHGEELVKDLDRWYGLMGIKKKNKIKEGNK